ncbi:MAG: hypothetical protein M1839_005943 [Geoglossum umbratile]|nr:MAG: hypothetical protein M1839_005943 [Geoglossum umbratile]
MGTSGFKIIRYRGKYFLYFTGVDSNPEIVGSEIVALIPNDPKRYKLWLESMRNMYGEMETVLDDLCTITTIDLLPRPFPTDPTRQRYRHYMGIDDSLFQLPSALAFPYQKEDSCWIYVIDLDREIFSVNYGVHYKLDSIPRREVWIKACDRDKWGAITLDAEVCGSECIASPMRAKQTVDRELVEEYQGFDIIRVEQPVMTTINPITDPTANYQIILLATFVNFSSTFSTHLQNFLLEWSPGDFLFRELAFAILSLAAGEFYFRARVQLDGSISHGYLIVPGDALGHGEDNLLPAFARGFHRPGKDAGSAPMETTYWFQGVLVCLAANINDKMEMKMAVARTVQFAHAEGHRKFYAIIISLEHVILLQVRACGGTTRVRHTDPIVLFEIANHLARDPRERPPQEPKYDPRRKHRQWSENVKSPTALCTLFPGFLRLINFLDHAFTQSLPWSYSPNEGVFPAEVYHMILMNVEDVRTYSTCAKVCRSFRNYCHSHIRVGNTIIKYGGQEKFKFHSGMTFTATDRVTGERGFVQLRDEDIWLGEISSVWSIVIGSPDRQSLLDHVGVAFDGLVVPKRPRTFWPRILDSDTYPTTGEIYTLHLPKYAPSIYTRRIWSNYLKHLLSPASFAQWDSSGSIYHCVLPPDLREVHIRFSRFRLFLFLQPPLPTPLATSKTASMWAQSSLDRICRRLEIVANQDCLVLITYGTSVGLFWWVVREGWERWGYEAEGGKLEMLTTLEMRKEDDRRALETTFWAMGETWRTGQDFDQSRWRSRGMMMLGKNAAGKNAAGKKEASTGESSKG